VRNPLPALVRTMRRLLTQVKEFAYGQLAISS
jgi:hypothetical protein